MVVVASSCGDVFLSAGTEKLVRIEGTMDLFQRFKTAYFPAGQ
jgi:hypothetical protein